MSADSIGKIADLLPCPFCGGCSELDSQQFFVDYQGHPSKQVAAYCVGSCGATITLCYGDTPDMEFEHRVAYVREQWNRRALPSAELERDALHAAYYAGWKKAASWAKRDDLIYDEGSMAYDADRDAALAEIAKEAKPKNDAFDTLPDDYETGDY